MGSCVVSRERDTKSRSPGRGERQTIETVRDVKIDRAAAWGITIWLENKDKPGRKKEPLLS